MFVDYLKPRRKIVNSLRCDTAPWSARRPACPWTREGGAEPYYDHYDYDYRHYNGHDNFDYQTVSREYLFSTLLSPNDHFQTTFAAGHPWLPLNW